MRKYVDSAGLRHALKARDTRQKRRDNNANAGRSRRGARQQQQQHRRLDSSRLLRCTLEVLAHCTTRGTCTSREEDLARKAPASPICVIIGGELRVTVR